MIVDRVHPLLEDSLRITADHQATVGEYYLPVRLQCTPLSALLVMPRSTHLVAELFVLLGHGLDGHDLKYMVASLYSLPQWSPSGSVMYQRLRPFLICLFVFVVVEDSL